MTFELLQCVRFDPVKLQELGMCANLMHLRGFVIGEHNGKVRVQWATGESQTDADKLLPAALFDGV